MRKTPTENGHNPLFYALLATAGIGNFMQKPYIQRD
ncbi:hypothetical protein GGQ67_002105 [Rhizobium metallidurans]|jgi:hypothetical protein|uniref:Uncharacterized protein n=1 Tax=Rhizobium metallidurans TaxID=1265931 RepID=A0A7W6GAB3_9HYPH|nr:hypothetical protein [Rhizobium metallidurans]